MVYRYDVTFNLSRWIKSGSDIDKQDQWKLKPFEKIVFKLNFT